MSRVLTGYQDNVPLRIPSRPLVLADGPKSHTIFRVAVITMITFLLLQSLCPSLLDFRDGPFVALTWNISSSLFPSRPSC